MLIYQELTWVRDAVLSGKARDLRIGAHLSLAEMCEAIGNITPAAVHGYENGKYLPRGEKALGYARVLHQLEKR